jgi:hypothetical protein
MYVIWSWLTRDEGSRSRRSVLGTYYKRSVGHLVSTILPAKTSAGLGFRGFMIRGLLAEILCFLHRSRVNFKPIDLSLSYARLPRTGACS